MDKSNVTRTGGLNIVTNQPTRKNSKSTGKIFFSNPFDNLFNSLDPLAKIRPMISKKPQLVPTLSRSNPTQMTSGLK
jgi:hypothetical protein